MSKNLTTFVFMISNATLTKFLKDNKSNLRYNDIEIATGLPQSILSKAVNGHRELSDEQAKKVIAYLEKVHVDLAKLFK